MTRDPFSFETNISRFAIIQGKKLTLAGCSVYLKRRLIRRASWFILRKKPLFWLADKTSERAVAAWLICMCDVPKTRHFFQEHFQILFLLALIFRLINSILRPQSAANAGASLIWRVASRTTCVLRQAWAPLCTLQVNNLPTRHVSRTPAVVTTYKCLPSIIG